MKIDINADIGEGCVNDKSLFPLISSCNIACGGHIGNNESINSSIKLAIKHDVKIGAHPSFPDKLNFGRKLIKISSSNLEKSLTSQINLVIKIARNYNKRIHHVKPHGALYNLAFSDFKACEIIINCIKKLPYKVSLFSQYKSLLSSLAKENGIKRINVSLDTINEEKYEEITRFGKLSNVLDGIEEAIKNKIKIKINVVAIKNFNEEEFIDLLEWASKIKVDLTFIEVMPMENTDTERHLQFLPLNKLYENLNSIYRFYKTDKKTGGPALYYKSKKLSNNIGFITPITNNFCSDCNRIRITSTGKLFMCLGQNDYIDFRDLLRKDFSNEYIKDKIKLALKIKPKRHDFIIEKNLKPYIRRHMNITGG